MFVWPHCNIALVIWPEERFAICSAYLFCCPSNILPSLATATLWCLGTLPSPSARRTPAGSPEVGMWLSSANQSLAIPGHSDCFGEVMWLDYSQWDSVLGVWPELWRRDPFSSLWELRQDGNHHGGLNFFESGSHAEDSTGWRSQGGDIPIVFELPDPVARKASLLSGLKGCVGQLCVSQFEFPSLTWFTPSRLWSGQAGPRRCLGETQRPAPSTRLPPWSSPSKVPFIPGQPWRAEDW